MTTISVSRPEVHRDDPLYAEHFRRLAEGRLAIRRCTNCIRYFAIYDGDPEELRCGMPLVGGFRAHGDSPELVWRAG
jgi:uncharacterized OB-fold protein